MTGPRFERLLWILPCILVLHVGEEWLADFPRYARQAMHGAAISVSGLLQNNAVILAILVALCLWASRRPSPRSAFALIAWASGHLFWNFAMHLYYTAATAQFSPGLVTGALLAYPTPLLVARTAMRQRLRTLPAMLGAFAIGAALMALLVWGGIYRFAH